MIEARNRQFEISSPVTSSISNAISFQTVLFLITSLIVLSGCLSDQEIDTPILPAGTTNISSTSASSFSPAIASFGQTVYIVWTDTANGTQEVFLVRSGDGGQTFSAPVNVSESVDEASVNPQIAVSGASVYVVWEEFLLDKGESDIFFRKAEDNNGTLTWSTRINLSDSLPICDDSKPPVGGPCPSQFPTIAADGNQVLVAWTETIHYVLEEITSGETGQNFVIVRADIFMVGSSDRGALFNLFNPSPITISKENTKGSLSPSLSAEPGLFYVAWTDFVPPNQDQGDAKILFRSFDGTVFNPPLTNNERILSNSINGSGNPSLAASNGNTYLVWEGSPQVAGSCQPSSDIFMVKSSDGFATTSSGTPTNISASDCRANNGKVSVSGANVYIVWEDNSPALSGILFRMSTDAGVIFSATTKLTNISGSVASPAISATGIGLYAAWESTLLGKLEIFFKKE